jgi:hypothetical protein
MIRTSKTLSNVLRLSAVAMALLLCGVGPFAYSHTSASPLQQRTLQLSNNLPGGVSEYKISTVVQTTGPLGSVKILFCSNLALLYYPCTPPAGFTLAAASIIAQSGVNGFSIDPSSTDNSLILTRTASPIAAGTIIDITIGGVTNQADAGASFARYYTYEAVDASGPVVDDGAVAYSLNEALGVSAEVPPYLTICVGTVIVGNDCSDVQGNFLQLGQFSITKASSGTVQVAVATNAENGYTVRILGPTMTSGNNIIPSLNAATPSGPGTSQFGINLRANSNPTVGNNPAGPGLGNPVSGYNQPNSFKYSSGDIIAGGTGVEDYRKYTVSYLVNISSRQPPGVYSSSFSYIGLGNF